jgi:RNA polymerase sigma-70 factor, ECF subfamily
MDYALTYSSPFQGVVSEENLLIQAANAGDLDSYNELVLRYQDAVLQLASRILKDENAAEDITQMVFMRAFHKLSSYYGGSFRAWVLKITTHLCLDELRRLARHPAISLDAEESDEDNYSLMDAVPLDGMTPEQEIVQREMQEIVTSTLQSLPLDFRLVIELVDLQEMSYAQAAEILRCPVGTVKSRLSRARLEFSRRYEINTTEKAVGD